MPDNTIKLTLDHAQVRAVIESELRNIKFTPQGSAVDYAFKEALKVNQSHIETAVGKLSKLTAGIGDAIAKLKGMEGTDKFVNELTAMFKGFAGQINAIGAQIGSGHIIPSDIFANFNAAKTLVTTASSAFSDKTVRKIMDGFYELDNVLNPTKTKSLEMMYGGKGNKDIDRAIKKHGVVWQSLFDSEKRMYSLLNENPELAKNNLFKMALMSQETVRSRLVSVSRDLPFELERASVGGTHNLPDLLGQLKQSTIDLNVAGKLLSASSSSEGISTRSYNIMAGKAQEITERQWNYEPLTVTDRQKRALADQEAIKGMQLLGVSEKEASNSLRKIATAGETFVKPFVEKGAPEWTERIRQVNVLRSMLSSTGVDLRANIGMDKSATEYENARKTVALRQTTGGQTLLSNLYKTTLEGGLLGRITETINAIENNVIRLDDSEFSRNIAKVSGSIQGLKSRSDRANSIIEAYYSKETDVIKERNLVARGIPSGSGDGGGVMSSGSGDYTDRFNALTKQIITAKEAIGDYQIMQKRLSESPQAFQNQLGANFPLDRLNIALQEQISLLEKGLGLNKSESTILLEKQQREERINALIREETILREQIATYSKDTDFGRANIAQIESKLAQISKAKGGSETAFTPQEQAIAQFETYKTRIKESTLQLEALKQKRAEVLSTKGTALFNSTDVKVLDQMIKQTEQVSSGLLRASSPLKRLGDGFKGLLVTMKQLAEWQAIWYATKSTIFMAPQIVQMGVEYTKQLDDWNFKLLRWGATSGKVTQQMRNDVSELTNHIRQTLLTVPAKFDAAAESIQGFIGAGVSVNTAKEMTATLATLAAAFPEIKMQEFGVAAVGAFNVFKDSIHGAEDEAGKFKIILEQLMRAQAESIVRPEQFSKIMQYMSEIGLISGMTTESIFALTTTIADTGATASSVSRILGSMMIQLAKPIAITSFQKLGIAIDEDATTFQNLDTVMRSLRGRIDASGNVPMKYMTYLQEFIPKREIQIFLSMLDRWDEFRKREAHLAKSSGSFDALLSIKQGSIGGQLELLTNTMKELGAAGNITSTSLMTLVKAGLDASRGALLSLNPGLAQTQYGFNSLGEAGKTAYAVINSIKTAITGLLLPLNGVWSIFKILVNTMNEFSTVVQILSDVLLAKLVWKMTGLSAMGIGTSIKNAFQSNRQYGVGGGMAQETAMMLGMAGGGAVSGKFTSPSLNRDVSEFAKNAQQPLANGTNAIVGLGTAASTTSKVVGNSFKEVGAAFISFLGPQFLVMAAVGTALYLWDRHRQSVEENARAVDNLAKGLTEAGESYAKLSDEALRYRRQKIEDEEATKRTTGWHTLYDASTGKYITIQEQQEKPRTVKRSDIEKRVRANFEGDINDSATELAVADEQVKQWKEKNKDQPLDKDIAWQQNQAASKKSSFEHQRDYLLGRIPLGTDIPQPEVDTFNIEETQLARSEDRKRKIAAVRVNVNALEIPPDHSKEYATQRANLIRENMNLELGIYKQYYDRLRSIAETNNQLGFTTSKEHFDQDLVLLKEAKDKEFDTSQKEYVEELAMLRKARQEKKSAASNRDRNSSLAKEDKEKKAIDEVYNLEEQKLALQQTSKLKGILLTFVKDSMSGWYKYYTSRKELAILENKNSAMIEEESFKRMLLTSQEQMTRRASTMDWLWDKNKVSVEEYTKFEKEKIQKTYQDEIDTARQAYAKWNKENEDRLQEAEGIFKTFDETVGNMPEFSIDQTKWDVAIAKLKKSLTDANIAVPEVLNSGSMADIMEYSIKKKINEELKRKTELEKEAQGQTLQTSEHSAEEKKLTNEHNLQIKLADQYRWLLKQPDGYKLVAQRALVELDKDWSDHAKLWADAVTSVFSGLQQTLNDVFFNVLDSKLQSIGEVIISIGNLIKKAIAEELSKSLMSSAIKPLMGNIMNLLMPGTLNASNSFSFFTGTQPLSNLGGGSSFSLGVPHLAGGGDVVANKMYMIGENGPEWYVPSSSGTVLPTGSGPVSGKPTVNFQLNVENRMPNQAKVSTVGGPKFDGRKLIQSVIIEDLTNTRGPIYRATRGV